MVNLEQAEAEMKKAIEKVVMQLWDWKFRKAYDLALEVPGLPYEVLELIGSLASMYENCGWQYGTAFEAARKGLFKIADRLGYRIDSAGFWSEVGRTVTLTNVGPNVLTFQGVPVMVNGPGLAIYENDKGEWLPYNPADGVPADAKKGGTYHVSATAWSPDEVARTAEDLRVMNAMAESWLPMPEPMALTYLFMHCAFQYGAPVFIKRNPVSGKFRLVHGENMHPESYMFKDSGMFGYTENREDVHKNEFDTIEEAVACFNKHWSQILK